MSTSSDEDGLTPAEREQLEAQFRDGPSVASLALLRLARMGRRRAVLSQQEYERQFHRPPTQEERDRVRELVCRAGGGIPRRNRPERAEWQAAAAVMWATERTTYSVTRGHGTLTFRTVDELPTEPPLSAYAVAARRRAKLRWLD